MDWFIALIPSFVVILALTGLERLGGRGQGDWWLNLQSWAIGALGGLTVYAAIQPWHRFSLIDGEALPAWVAVVLYVLVQDLGEYLFHRAQHKLPLLWEMHSLHHSDPDMAALTTYRHFWGDRLIKVLTVYSLAGLVVSPTPLAFSVYVTLSLWNLVSHANIDWSLGTWSWAINTPAYHRRHHSALPEHYDSNFAALFPIWDVAFGDYHVPDGFPETGFERRPRNLRDLLLWPVLGTRRPATQIEPAA